MKIQRQLLVGVGLVVLSVIGLLILDQVFPMNLTRLEKLSAIVESDQNEVLRVFSTPEGLLRLESKATEVDPKYLQFLIAYEDKRFDQHFGVDPLALMRATWQWITAGRIISGGSTLTMQVARLLEPRPRTIRSKLLEILRAMQLEWHLSKREILNIYVTLAPFGGRLEGIKSASLAYFKKLPKQLTIAEAALLTVIPQSPSRLRPDRFPVQSTEARKKVLSRLMEQNIISTDEFVEADGEPIPEKQYSIPKLAPHLSERLVRSYPDKQMIKTTLNVHLQSQIQSLIQAYTKHIDKGVSAAVIVVENNGRRTRVHVGSNNYLDSSSHGFIDMTQAVRSPGSTLKPLIYALSFEDRQTHPQTLIFDRAQSGASYRPSNFDGSERGQITVADSLRFSLNIPAVKILNLFGPVRFSETLRKHNVALRLPHHTSKPNLAIALGGTGVTLEELVTIYSAFASDRKICPLNFTEPDHSSSCNDTPELISSQTQEWIQGILENTPRPEGYRLTGTSRKNKIAFKTGTSYGYRDAWAIGYNQDFTVGVWTGAASGRPVMGQTGLNTAAPLLFSVFEKLPEKMKNNIFVETQAWRDIAPDALKIFKDDFVSGQGNSSDDRPEISYPLNETALLLSDIASTGVLLKAQKGKRPLTWLINGVPLSSRKWKRETRWNPKGPGFYHITVLDQNASANSKYIEIR